MNTARASEITPANAAKRRAIAVVKSDVCTDTTCIPVKESPKIYCANEIGTRFGSAVVGIKIIPKFQTFWQNFNRFVEEVYGATHFNAGILPMSGTGYFQPNGYIHSSTAFMAIMEISAFVQTFSVPWCWEPGTNEVEPNVAAFLNPHKCPDPTTPYTNRYANLAAFSDVLNSLCNGKNIAQWFEFYIDVTQNTPNSCPVTYRASLFGMDFDTGFASFRINNSDPFNNCSDPLVRQGFLKYGNSKGALPGSRVFCLYDSRVTGPKCVASGVVSDNSALLRDGSVTYEMLTTDIVVSEGAEGAPIINESGYVVGMVTGITETGQAVAVSSTFLERIYTSLEQAASAGGDCNNFAPWIAAMGCRVYRHGTLKMTYHTKTASDINQAFLAVATGTKNSPCSSCHSCMVGTSCEQNRDGDYWRKRFYTYQNCSIAKDIRGIILDTDPCGDLARATEQCSTNDPNYGQVRNRYVRVEQGDLLTYINNVELGGLRHQYSPDTIFFGIEACTCVTIRFRKKSELYTEEHCLEVKTDDSLDWISSFVPCCKPCLDYCPEKCLADPTLCKGDLLMNMVSVLKAVNCWVSLIRWFTRTMPQVYRANFFGNFNHFMTRLNEWINLLVMPFPAGDQTAMAGKGDTALLQLSSALKAAIPGFPDLACIYKGVRATPMSKGLALTALSRAMVTMVADSSVRAAVKPLPFFDFVASFAHPSDACAFDQLVPNYLAMAGSKISQYATALAPCAVVTPGLAYVPGANPAPPEMHDFPLSAE